MSRALVCVEFKVQFGTSSSRFSLFESAICIAVMFEIDYCKVPCLAKVIPFPSCFGVSDLQSTSLGLLHEVFAKITPVKRETLILCQVPLVV